MKQLVTSARLLFCYLRKRVDALYYDRTGMSFQTQNLNIPLTAFSEAVQTEHSEVYLFMSKNGTKPETVKAWQDAATEMKQDGTFQKISEKWYSTTLKQMGIQAEIENGVLNL